MHLRANAPDALCVFELAVEVGENLRKAVEFLAQCPLRIPPADLGLNGVVIKAITRRSSITAFGFSMKVVRVPFLLNMYGFNNCRSECYKSRCTTNQRGFFSLTASLNSSWVIERSPNPPATSIKRTHNAKKHVAVAGSCHTVLKIRFSGMDWNRANVRVPDVVAEAREDSANLVQLILKMINGRGDHQVEPGLSWHSTAPVCAALHDGVDRDHNAHQRRDNGRNHRETPARGQWRTRVARWRSAVTTPLTIVRQFFLPLTILCIDAVFARAYPVELAIRIQGATDRENTRSRAQRQETKNHCIRQPI